MFLFRWFWQALCAVFRFIGEVLSACGDLLFDILDVIFSPGGD